MTEAGSTKTGAVVDRKQTITANINSNLYGRSYIMRNYSNYKIFTFVLTVVLCLMTMLTATANAATLNVPSVPYPTIQDAVTAAGNGDTIVVAAGMYTGAGNYDIDFGSTDKNLTLLGDANNPANVIIDCGGSGRAFYFHAAETAATVINGFTIQNGSEYYGGAIECKSSSPTIENCIIQFNDATSGGAIDCFYASPIIKDCRIILNYCEFDGSAIGCYQSSPQITNCLFYGNSADGYGTISCYEASSPVITNCTVANNYGSDDFGGLYVDDGSAAVKNSIFWSNGDDIYGASATYSCIQDGDSGAGNISIYPDFVMGASGYYYLSSMAAGQLNSSACINSGDADANTYFTAGMGYTTTTDEAEDSLQVDMGYHYSSTGTAATQYYSLVTYVAPGGGTGSISPNNPDPNQFYPAYSQVVISATPDTDCEIETWLENGVETINDANVTAIVVTMDANQTVGIRYQSTVFYQLDTSVAGGNGSITPVSGTQRKNTTVDINAIPDAGYLIDKWSGTDDDNSVALTNTVFMDGAKSVSVSFEPNVPVLLDTRILASTDGIKHGRIEPSRSMQALNSTVALTAVADANYKLVEWQNTDDDSSTEPNNAVTMTSAKTVYARFELAPQYTLTVNIVNPTGGTVVPSSETYYEGQTATITATPNTGYSVKSWASSDANDSADVDGITDNVINILMDVDTVITLEFQPAIVLADSSGTEKNRYETIQEALDAASVDGDIVIVPDGTWTGIGNYDLLMPSDKGLTLKSVNGPNSTIIDCGGLVRGITIPQSTKTDPVDPNIIINNLAYILDGFTIINGQSDKGGGILADTNTAPLIQNCIIQNCSAAATKDGDGGGGIYFAAVASESEDDVNRPIVANCLITNNTTTGNGGGVYCTGSKPLFRTTEISYNNADGSSSYGLGGGVYCSGETTPAFINCLIHHNTADGHGGAMYLHNSSAVINLCTIMYNPGLEGTGIFARDSEPAISHCIIGGSDRLLGAWNSSSGDDLRGCEATHSCIENGDDNDGDGSIGSNPRFISGTLGDFYLSQSRAGQAQTSACVNGGEDYFLSGLQQPLTTEGGYGLERNLSTGITDIYDVLQTDIGYHYPFHNIDIFYQVHFEVSDPEHGTFTATDMSDNTYAVPGDYNIAPGSLIELVAQPITGYRVSNWSGTDDDSSFSVNNTVHIYNNPTTVILTFELIYPSDIHVSGDSQYTNIQQAIDDARDGDRVIIEAGEYVGTGFYVDGKNITISGQYPDDANQVIIDCTGENVDNDDFSIARFDLIGAPGGYCTLQGVTIRNFDITFRNTLDADDEGASADDVGWDFGGAIWLQNQNHIVRNCIIEDITFRGGNGGAGHAGGGEVHDGGDGGDGGNTYGGGIVVLGGSPTIENCIIRDCNLIGGDGGNAGAGNSDTGTPANSGVGGRGGYPGGAAGAGVLVWSGHPTFRNCTIQNCNITGGTGGTGGDSGYGAGPGGYGAPSYYDSTQVSSDYLTCYGAAAFVLGDATFTDCKMENNSSKGTTSGVGGWSDPSNLQQQPNRQYDIASYGAGVFVCGELYYYGTLYDELHPYAILNNCKIQNNQTEFIDNYYTGYGGAVASFGSASIDVNDCNLINNSAATGGAVYGRGMADLHIFDTEIADNKSYIGGGIFVSQTDAFTVQDSLVQNNAATFTSGQDLVENYASSQYVGSGGGIYCFTTDANIFDSTIKGNSATGKGGGLYLAGEPQTIYPLLATPEVFNCLITNNNAGEYGGGIATDWSTQAYIHSCTIADNVTSSATGKGGGLFCGYESDVTARDNIFWGNSAITGSQIALSNDSLDADTTTVFVNNCDIDLTVDLGADVNNVGTTSTSLTTAKLVGSSEIYNEINTSGTAKVIVTLAEPEEVTQVNFASASSVASMRAQVASLQNSVISNFAGGEFSLRNKLANAAIFSGNVSVEGLARLLNDENVAHVEPVRELQFMTAQGIPLMGAAASRSTYNGQGMSIAIVDSGIDYTHPALGGGNFPNSKVIGGYDFGDGDDDPMPSVSAHGTACAGIAAGSLGTAGDYIGGVAYNSKIYALKIENSEGDIIVASDSGLTAWDWCITHQNDDEDNPIMVISNSWGSAFWTNDTREADSFSPAYTNAAEKAKQAGITILAASGNELKTDTIVWPASMSDVISVGAVYDDKFLSNACGIMTTPDAVTCYSNTAEILDVLAPSENAYTTDIVGSGGYTTGNYYEYFNGTSSATPYAAGAVAALQSAAKEIRGAYLSPAAVRELLTNTGRQITDTKAPITKPRIDLAAAIALLSDSGPIYTGDGCTLAGIGQDANDNWVADANYGNISDDPNFTIEYYLSSIDTGDINDSPCFDAGSTTAVVLGLDSKTTRVDGYLDNGFVDIGYHYPDGLPSYELTVDVNVAEANGTIAVPYVPGSSYNLYKGKTAELIAVPDDFSRVKKWILDGEDVSTHNKTFSLVMDSNHTITAVFEYYAPSTLIVPDQYQTIQEAVDNAEDGDTIFVYPKVDGNPHYISDPCGINFNGKAIIIRSADPNDPCVVAETIIDCNSRGRAFIFDDREDANSIIEGFTIKNAWTAGAWASGYELEEVAADSETSYYIRHGVDAVGDGFGGAVYCGNYTSPVIRNCVFENCRVTGGVGSDGGDGYGADTYSRSKEYPRVGEAGSGGDGSGNGYGGVFYIGQYASPKIAKCSFNDCIASGGVGGEGGNGSDSSENVPGDGGDGGNGSGDGFGGVIYCAKYASPKIEDCNFFENTASKGIGGDYGLQGAGKYPGEAPYPRDGVAGEFSGAAFGGVIYYQEDNYVGIDNCKMIDNTADADRKEDDGKQDGGGAVYVNAGSDGDIYKSVISGNSATNGYGGAMVFMSDSNIVMEACYFGGNSAANNGGALCIGDEDDANQSVFRFENCAFTDNSSQSWGGAILARDADVNFVDCYINRNTAQAGGGAYFIAESNIEFHSGTIMNNSATGTNAEGGGLMLSDTPISIFNCRISENSSLYSGGAVMLKGQSSSGSLIQNCLFADNQAETRGGAVMVSVMSSVSIKNSTFDRNSSTATGNGGAVYCAYASTADINDCVITNTQGTALSEGSYDANINFGHLLLWRNVTGDFYNKETTEQRLYKSYYPPSADANGTVVSDAETDFADLKLLAQPVGSLYKQSSNDPNEAPVYDTGDLGEYYLYQDTPESPNYTNCNAVNHGSAEANSITVEGKLLSEMTTRIDNVGDEGLVDIGFHYFDANDSNALPKFTLTTKVIGGHGSIVPDTNQWHAGTTVKLEAVPDSGWRVKQWSGTDDDSSFSNDNYVVITYDKTVTVEFEQPDDLFVPSEYTALQYAINDAKDGDKIILAPGTYKYADINYDYGYIYINDRDITITSGNPDDPCVVADTIILSSRFYITNVSRNMVLDGLTIRDAHYAGNSCNCTLCGSGPSGDGRNGYGILGGAMVLYDASPIIRNCRFESNTATGGNGSPGCGEGGDGGWGGYARGGAVGIGENSNPLFRNCDFIDNIARGGNGGNADSTDGHGGSWGDPNGDVSHTWDWACYDKNADGDYDDLGDDENNYADYWLYSGYGGAIYCSSGTNPEFEDCLFQDNVSYGGVCGTSHTGHWPWPQRHYAIDTFGGAVYIADDSGAKFTGCKFVNNRADTRDQLGDVNGIYDSNDFALSDAVVSYGGAVCAEGSAMPVFKNCDFTGSVACGGGTMYWEDSVGQISGTEIKNSISMLGGAMAVVDSNITAFDCNFSDSYAYSPVGEGGGVYSAGSQSIFYDSLFQRNFAHKSGGGLYFTGERTSLMHNCIVTDNLCNKDGGGISANWDAQLTVENCTIAENEVSGSIYMGSLGGGISAAYEAFVTVINSILWGNAADVGSNISIGTPYEAADKYRAEVSVEYSDVKEGQAGVFVDDESDCVLHWNSGNLTGTSATIPGFVKGYWGDYYLNQPPHKDANESVYDSPCVDAGSGSALENYMFRHTTNKNHSDVNDANYVPGDFIDADIVDMGWHYLLRPEIVGDFDYDGDVDFDDITLFFEYWMETNCQFPYYCYGRDLTEDGEVDFDDYALISANYGDQETEAPHPNPMTWASVPRSSGVSEISMIATTAKDNSGSKVEYFIQRYLSDGSIDNDFSPVWQSEPNLIDEGLTTGMQYGYRVKARDARGNETGWSAYGFSVPGEDWTPPTPNPMEWLSELNRPMAVSPNSIEMTAATATDPCGVKYRFYEVSGNPGGTTSEWQTEPYYLDTGLEPNTPYEYYVVARDESNNYNTTGRSSIVRTFTPDVNDTNTTDVNAPSYTPVNGMWSVLPQHVPVGESSYILTMTAVGATDDTLPVWYWFECTTDNDKSSSWIPSEDGAAITYTITNLFSYNHQAFRVHIKDSADPPNEIISRTYDTMYGEID